MISRLVDPRIAKLVLQRDGHCLYGWWSTDPRCTNFLSAHHLHKRSQQGPDALENMVTLCSFHHDQAEAHRISSQELRLILQETYGYEYTEAELGTSQSSEDTRGTYVGRSNSQSQHATRQNESG